MKTLFKGLALASILLLTTVDAQTQDLKIGYVDPQVILSRMPETAAVQVRLQNFTQRKQQEIQNKELELQNEVALYEQKVGVISEDARAKEEQRLQAMQQDLINLSSTAEQELAAKRAELLGPLQQQILGAINTVASRKGLDYVFNTTTSTGDVIILYASEEMRNNNDITPDVMAELDIE